MRHELPAPREGRRAHDDDLFEQSASSTRAYWISEDGIAIGDALGRHDGLPTGHPIAPVEEEHSNGV